ncbi:uncharacterized protein LOC120278590 [Dioscorea cayenensis subsp. rotundata]|uniref:Uncharacterized protein LOC120278590 n=1 Tax=Dioscorea cayennensis subsp. rotundata TaxID=55577 RepID=A0AB40CT72_DIOCR|nr:uncharacterized protein LOC120278590 [Dioscorea cayenensis subsp. rotundata]
MGWGDGGVVDPCSWFGIGCSNGRLMALSPPSSNRSLGRFPLVATGRRRGLFHINLFGEPQPSSITFDKSSSMILFQSESNMMSLQSSDLTGEGDRDRVGTVFRCRYLRVYVRGLAVMSSDR